MILIRATDNAQLVYDITQDSFIFSRATGEIYKENRESLLSACSPKEDAEPPSFGIIGSGFIKEIPEQFRLVESVIKTNADNETPSLLYQHRKPYVKKCAICGQVHEYFFVIHGEYVCPDCLPLVEVCSHCGKIIKKGSRNTITYKNKKYCKECRDSLFEKCELCQKWELLSEITIVHIYTRNRNPREEKTARICKQCVSSGFTQCIDCGKYISDYAIKEVAGHGEVCPICLASGPYVQCAGCSRYYQAEDMRIDSDDDMSYCRSCYQNRNRFIYQHWSKLAPIFHGEGPLFFGIEQEIDNGDDQEGTAEQIIKTIGKKELYIETDGSLGDNGLELVYFPRSWNAWKEFMPSLVKVQEIARENGYKSHETNTCGLHIHASRDAIRSDEFPDIDENIGKIIALYENNYKEFVRFSRREQEELDQWARRNTYSMKKGEPKKMYCAASRGNRYKAVNIVPDSTVEFRFFRGSLLPNTVMASINLVKNMIDISISKTSEEIDSVTFDQVLNVTENPILAEYWEMQKERGVPQCA